jgi:hypothetical protein
LIFLTLLINFYFNVRAYYDIIEHYFEVKLDKNIPFIELYHSPAEVLDICTLYTDDIKTAISKLTKK